MSKKGLWSIPVIAAVIVIMLFIYSQNKPDVTEGTKSVGVTVIDDEGGETQYFIGTDAQACGNVAFP